MSDASAAGKRLPEWADYMFLGEGSVLEKWRREMACMVAAGLAASPLPAAVLDTGDATPQEVVDGIALEALAIVDAIIAAPDRGEGE